MSMEYWKARSRFMEDLIYKCGGDIADICGEYITFNPEPNEAMCEANSNAVLADVRVLREEAKIMSEVHPSKDARFFAGCVYKFLSEHFS